MIRQIKKSFSRNFDVAPQSEAENAGDPCNGDQDSGDHRSFCPGNLKGIHCKGYYHFQKSNAGGGCCKQHQDKEDHTEKLSSGHLPKDCRQRLEHKAGTAFRIKSEGKNCRQYGKTGQHCHQGIAAGNAAGAVGDLLIFSQISPVSNGGSRTQRQGEEDLSQGSQEGSRGQLGKIRFQEKFNTRACPRQRTGTDRHSNNTHQKKRHHYLAGLLNSLLNSSCHNKHGQDHKDHIIKDLTACIRSKICEKCRSVSGSIVC